MYHDFLGREIEDAEMDNMRRDSKEEQEGRMMIKKVLRPLRRLFICRANPYYCWIHEGPDYGGWFCKDRSCRKGDS